MRILYAEDERDLNDIVTRKLRDEGYSVDSCDNGQDAWDSLQAAEYDGVVLDVMMPRMDGLTVLRRLRQMGRSTPVLLLTARDAVSDRVEGLDSGANDYLVKPFALEELAARLRAMLRVSFGQTGNVLRVGDLELDCAAKTACRGGRPISLSAREYAILEYLMRSRGVVLSREKIENHVWNFDYEGGTNVVDVYIRYLRKKIDEGQEKKLIHTVRGLGYVLREEP
ncbi:MAG: response regulator transcription factor [Christensenellales bacterium]|nr:response regulator transcription factor [Christensenellales bacterium]